MGTPRVLIIDDEDVICRMLESLLAGDYTLASVGSAEAASELLASEPADVVLVDKNLPGRSGLDLLRDLKRDAPDTEVIVITGYASLQSAVEALRLGAYDYLVKPFDDISIVAQKVQRAVEKKELAQEHRQLMSQLLASNQELRSAHERLRRGYMESLTSIVAALEARDAYTRGHSERVALYAVRIGEEMGLSPERLTHLRDGGRVHDVGKIGIREDILNKTGRLSDEEYAHIQLHPGIGADILQGVEAFRHLLPMVLSHHERWDGNGYPQGLRADDIALEARITAVADCFDAMTSSRPYREPRTVDQALGIIREVAGSQLDPQAVGAFLMAHRRGALQQEPAAERA